MKRHHMASLQKVLALAIAIASALNYALFLYSPMVAKYAIYLLAVIWATSSLVFLPFDSNKKQYRLVVASLLMAYLCLAFPGITMTFIGIPVGIGIFIYIDTGDTKK